MARVQAAVGRWISRIIGPALATALVGSPTLAGPPVEASTSGSTEAAFELFAVMKYVAASAAFRASYRLSPDPETLLFWALTEQLARNCATARTLYRRFLATDPSASDREFAESNAAGCRNDSLSLLDLLDSSESGLVDHPELSQRVHEAVELYDQERFSAASEVFAEIHADEGWHTMMLAQAEMWRAAEDCRRAFPLYRRFLATQPPPVQMRAASSGVAQCWDAGPGRDGPMVPWVGRNQLVHVAKADPLWRHALHADVIAYAHGLRVEGSRLGGRTSGPADELKRDEYRSLTVDVEHVFVGAPADTLTFEYRCGHRDKGRRVPCRMVRRWAARPTRSALIFLEYWDDRLFLIPSGSHILRHEIDEARLRSIEEFRRGARERLGRAGEPQVGEEVARLVDELARHSLAQADAMLALIELGPVAAPAIVRHLGDDRKLPLQLVTVENSPGAFEARAMYGVATVSAVLSLLLVRLVDGPHCPELINRVPTPRAVERCKHKWEGLVARGLDEGLFGSDWK